MATIKFNPNLTNSEREALGREFSPNPPSRRWLATLNQQPVFSPNFAGTIALAADNQVLSWLRANAPADILDLYRGAMSLRTYEQEFQDGNGMVSADANSSILGTVAECINALDRLDDEWINTTP